MQKPVGADHGPLQLIPTPRYRTGNTDQFTMGATGMALVHNVFIRGFNSIYLQAPNVKSPDYKNFIGYSLAWYESLHSHHEGEELYFFPEVERQAGVEGIMEDNLAQHEAFTGGLDAFKEYLHSLRGREKEFSGSKLVSIMDSFKDMLSQHLNDEIPTILGLAKFGDKIQLLSIMDDEAKKAMGGMSQVAAIPFVFLNIDSTFEEGIHASFPPLPAAAKLWFTRVCTCWNWGFWKFASCDAKGRPKPLYCA